MRVFLGGTVDGYNWRKFVMEELDKMGIEYFNPVVDNYTEECRMREDAEKANCDALLFVITNDIAGVYSVAEVTECAILRPRRVVFCNMYQKRQSECNVRMGGSLGHTERLLCKYTPYICHDLHTAIAYLETVRRCYT